MKKSLAVVAASMLLALPLAFQGSAKPVELQAYEPVGATTCGAGLEKLTIHFHAWDADDLATTGAWNWSTGTGGTAAPVAISSIDDFGAVFEYCINPADAGDLVGFLPLNNWAGPEAGWAWDDNAKMTAERGDILIDITTLKNTAATEMEVYIFEGAGGKANDTDKQRGVYEVDPTKRNIIIGYYDPANAYEETLGIHPWGSYDAPLNAAEWGTPVQFFENGATSPSGVPIKFGMATAIDDDSALGGLIYAGTDDSKKHAGAANSFADPFAGFAAVEAGEVAFSLVVNDQIFGNAVDFAAEAFKFEFMDREVLESGLVDGTYAVDPNTVLVKTNVKVAVTDDKEAVKGRFSLMEGENVVAISSVDYDVNAASSNTFVLNLGANLSVSKTYMLKYDDGINTTESELDIDADKPVITFLDTDVDVEIELGAEWDSEFVPSFVATDNRDGDITSLVYIAPGDGYVNTGITGDYVVTFTVKDVWGNIGEASFTVSVVEPEVTGGCATTAEGGNNGIGLLVSLLGAAWLLKKSALGVAK